MAKYTVVHMVDELGGRNMGSGWEQDVDTAAEAVDIVRRHAENNIPSTIHAPDGQIYAPVPGTRLWESYDEKGNLLYRDTGLPT